MVNFIQTVYLFKFVTIHTEGMYHFLNGFGFMHIFIFPNFFYGAIPPDYVEYPVEPSLIPDSNFIRNAGNSISFLIIVILILIIASIVSFSIYKTRFLHEWPQIRKICRIFILLGHFTFQNILFSALLYFIQPF